MRRPCFDALEVRVVPSTDIVASVDGYASGVTNGQYTTLNTTDYQVYTDYMRTEGLIEFDLSGISPGSVITSATLTGTFWSAQYNNLDGYAAANFYGYTGDGQITLSDATAPDYQGSTPVASFSGASGSQALSSSVLADFLQSIVDSGVSRRFAGLQMRLSHGEELGISSTEASQYAAPPTLHIQFAGNSPPTAANDSYSTPEDTPLVVAAPGVLANDTDPDNDPLTAGLIAPPVHGSLTLNADGSFVYTPDANFNGADAFTYVASDGTNQSTYAIVSINVTPVDDPPDARDDAYVVDQGSSLTVADPADSGGAVLRYGFDEASGPAAVDTGASPGADGTLQGAAGRTAPGPGGLGGALDLTGGTGYVTTGVDAQKLDAPTALTLTAWINLQGTPAAGDLLMSDAPSTGSPFPPAGVGGWLFQIDTPWNNSNPLSASNFALSFGVRQSDGTSMSTSYSTSYALSADHKWVFVAMTMDATGLQTFYQGDEAGAAQPFGGQFIQNAPIRDNTTPFQVGGSGLDAADRTPPAWLDDVRVYDRALSRDELAGVQAEDLHAGVLANDDDPEGDPFTAQVVTGPAHGTLSLAPNGAFTYTPDPAFTGTDSFTYEAVEGQLASAPATVTLTVQSFNSPPAARDDSYTTNEDAPLVLAAPGVLANDIDPDGDAITALLVTGPSHGTLALNADGSFTYTPAADYNGGDSFTYKANDGQADSNVATVSITVNPVNDAPVANDDAYTIDEDSNLVVPQASGAALRYSFDEASAGASLALDSGASPAANGTFDGFATRVGDTPGGASRGALDLTADGAASNDVTTGVDVNKIDALSALTVTMWINLRDVPTDGDVLISDDPPFPSGANTGGWALSIHDANGGPNTPADLRLFSEFDEQTTSGSGRGQGMTWQPIDADKRWVFVAMTYSAGHVLSTFSGDEQAAVSLLGYSNFDIPLLDNATALRIGGSTLDPAHDHTPPAWIDDVRIYGRDLSQSELDDVRRQNLTRGGVLANDTDVDGDPLTAVLVSGPQHGTLNFNADGTFSYIPAPNFNGVDSFTYKSNDGQADSNIATVTITVNPVDDAPVAANDRYVMDEDTTLTVPVPGVLANDTDVEGDPLKAILVTPPSFGSLTLNPDGSFAYTPPANVYGQVAFAYKANDGQLDSARAFVFITINPVNDPPVAQDDAYSTPEDTPLTVAAPGVLGNDSDTDSPSITAVLFSGPSHGSLALNADGSFTYTPAADYNGSDSFTYQANDGQADSNVATVSLTVTPVNDAPVARDDAYATDEDVPLTVAAPGVLGNDGDIDSATIMATLVSGPGHGSLALNADGSFSYTPAANYNGTDSFTYQANDGSLGSAPATVTLTINAVNSPPVAQDDAYATPEDTPLTVVAPGVLGNDSDIDSPTITAALVSGPSHGSLALAADGSFTYTPAADYNGPDSFTYEANDGQSDSNVATVSLTVTPVNDPPAARDDAFSTDEDTPLTVGVPGVLRNDSDIDSPTITAALVSGPGHGSLALNADGSFSYTPAANYNGTDSFTYQANDGSLGSAPATVTLTINAVDDRPVAQDDAYATSEDTPLTVAAPGVLGNDSDVDSPAITAALVSGPGHGTVALNADGSFTYTPAADYNGSDSFTYEANDGQSDSNVATVSITVNPVNDPPVARDDAFSTDEDTPIAIAAPGVLGNDGDVDSAAITAVLVSGPSHGSLALAADGSFTYTPAADFNGTDSFVYQANDGSLDSAPATVVLTVRPVNDPPVATADAYAVDEDTSLTVAAPGVLGNDTDIDSPRIVAILVSQPSHGTLTFNGDGSFSYTPAPNYNGTDSFTYKANDGQADSSPATVAITIRPVNDPPVAAGDAYTTDQDTSLTVAAPGVLGNDSDIDSPTLTAVLVAGPSHGSLTLNPDGSFTYTPAAGFSGADSFTYQANDGQADSAPATVSLTVTPLDQPPVAQTPPATVTEDGQTSITLGGQDDRTPASALVFRITSLPARGVLSVGSTPVKVGDSFTGTPTLTYRAAIGLDDVGADSFGYSVTDSADQTTGGVVAVTVQKAVADGTAVLGSDGVLRVGGTAGADVITIGLVKSRGVSTLQVTLGSMTIGTFTPSSVHEVRAWGRDGNDQIKLNGLAVDAVLQGGAGDDNLIGGGGSNIEFGGSGRDTLKGGSQADLLVGGADADSIDGNGGDDVLIGGQLARPWTLADARSFLASWDSGGNPQNTTDLSVIDSAIDALQGGPGRDLFVVGTGDTADSHKKDVVIVE